MKARAAFSGFSVDDLTRARDFYQETLGLEVGGDTSAGLQLKLPRGGEVFVYAKPGHQAANFTILNFVVDNIEGAVDELAGRGVRFERYTEGPGATDERGIARGKEQNTGPDIAWFRDPAGNILAVLELPD